MMNKSDLFIEKANKIHNNKYNYLQVKYNNAKEKIIITCNLHGNFVQTPNAHLSGAGCIKCSHEKTSQRMSISWNDYMESLNKIHKNKYNYSKVIWKGVDEKIIVICPLHENFTIRPVDHKNGRGCPLCSKEKNKCYDKIDTENFINKSIEIHGNLYDYSLTQYNGSSEYIYILCYKHGKFKQLPSNHYKYGCKKCGNENNIRNKQLNSDCKDNFESKAQIIHNNKYNYFNSIYNKSNTKLNVTCKIHGDFEITPNNHLKGKGCPDCGQINSSVSKFKSFDEYHNLFINKHGTVYNYSCVEWVNASTKINVMCKKHGEFEILPYAHKNGAGCPSCSNQYSKKSIEWLNYLSIKYNLNIQHALNNGEKYIFGKNKADGYCEENNTIYEFHGDFWHGNPNLYNPDKINPRNGKKFGELFKKTLHKELSCRQLGYNYICIWETDWNKFKIKNNNIV